MRILIFLAVLFLFTNCKNDPKKNTSPKTKKKASLMAGADTLIYPEEKYFKSIRQITFGGDNAEAYWSWDDQQMIFQSNNADWAWNAIKCS